jgi:hypothetical protein
MKLTKLENAHFDSALSLVGQGNLNAAAPIVASLCNGAKNRAKQKFFWLTAMRWGLVDNAGFVTAFKLRPTGANNNRVPVLTGWPK